jgi:hypothetical protein
LIFDLIDNVVFVVFALYSSDCSFPGLTFWLFSAPIKEFPSHD